MTPEEFEENVRIITGILTGPSPMMKTIMLVTPKALSFSTTHPIIMKTKNPRLVFGDDEFTFFRLNLLKEVETQKRLFNQLNKERTEEGRRLSSLSDEPSTTSTGVLIMKSFLIHPIELALICLVSSLYRSNSG